MLTLNNLKIIKVEEVTGRYDAKKQKHIKYKKPRTKTTILHEESYVDLGELYEAAKFHTEKNMYDTIKVEFTTKVEF